MISNLLYNTVMEDEDQRVKETTYDLLTEIGYEYLRPSQANAHRFIRRKYNLHIEVVADKDMQESFYYAVATLGGGYVTSIFDVRNNYQSHEEAYEAGILHAIQYVKKLPRNHSR